MISRLTKAVMEHFKLDQKALAELLDVPLHRVKSLSSGRVQKFTRSESEALVRKLKINPEWLITGEEPMVDDETDDEFADRIQAVSHMQRVVAALPLDDLGRKRLQVLMTGDPAADGEQIGRALLESARSVEAARPYPTATVTHLPMNEPQLLTRQQVLEIVLDAMHQAGKALPAKAVQALVDTAMELQRAGVPVKKSAFDAQLRAVQ